MKRTFTIMLLTIATIVGLFSHNLLMANAATTQHPAKETIEVNLLLPSNMALADGRQMMASIGNQNSEFVIFDAILEVENLRGNVVFSSIKTGNLVEAKEVIVLTFDEWIPQSGDFTASLSLQSVGGKMIKLHTKNFSVVAGRTVLKPLYEMFTSSTCGPCAYANPILDALLAANAGNHSIIKYQMNWPGQGDPYYHPDGGTRSQFYSVSGVPDLRINAQAVVPSQMTQEIYDSFLGQASELEIQISNAYVDLSGNLEIETTISVAESLPEGLTLLVAVLEKITTENIGSNGEKEFHHLMMKMFPDGNGSQLPALTPGVDIDFDFQYSMDQTFVEKLNRLEVVVFVQDDQTKAIIQSETVDVAHDFVDYTVTFEVKDSYGDPVPGAYLFLNEYGSAHADDAGQAAYPGVFPGAYDYEITASGLYPAEGTVEVTDIDVLVEIALEAPELYFYEDFYQDIPADWTLHVTSPDFLYWAGESVIFFRQSPASNPIVLVAPEIDLAPAHMLYFDAGEAQGAVNLILGTMTDPNDPDTFTELETFAPSGTVQTYSYDISQLENPEGLRFAWKHQGGVMTYFSFDNVIVTAAEMQTYSLFLDADPQIAGTVTGNGDYFPDNEITITATANTDWVFVEWTTFEGAFVSNEAEFVYVMPENDVILVAHFETNVNISLPEISEVIVYPNPAGSRFAVSASDIIHQIIITDLAGRVIYRQQHNQKKVSIPTDGFSAGEIYFVEILTAKDTTVRKLRVLK